MSTAPLLVALQYKRHPSLCHKNEHSRLQQNNEFQKNIIYERVLSMPRCMPCNAIGYYASSSKVIRNIAPIIAKPIFMIYQQLVFNSVFPMAWQKARLTTIYKSKGSRNNPKSYCVYVISSANAFPQENRK